MIAITAQSNWIFLFVSDGVTDWLSLCVSKGTVSGGAIATHILITYDISSAKLTENWGIYEHRHVVCVIIDTQWMHTERGSVADIQSSVDHVRICVTYEPWLNSTWVVTQALHRHSTIHLSFSSNIESSSWLFEYFSFPRISNSSPPAKPQWMAHSSNSRRFYEVAVPIESYFSLEAQRETIPKRRENWNSFGRALFSDKLDMRITHVTAGSSPRNDCYTILFPKCSVRCAHLTVHYCNKCAVYCHSNEGNFLLSLMLRCLYPCHGVAATMSFGRFVACSLTLDDCIREYKDKINNNKRAQTPRNEYMAFWLGHERTNEHRNVCRMCSTYACVVCVICIAMRMVNWNILTLSRLCGVSYLHLRLFSILTMAFVFCSTLRWSIGCHCAAAQNS